MFGGAAFFQRTGSSSFSASKMRSELACHSPPPGVVMLSIRSIDSQRHAISRSAKLFASIWSRGEYFVLL